MAIESALVPKYPLARTRGQDSVESKTREGYSDERLVERLRTLLSHHPEISLAILFGSLAAGKAGPDSDIDLAISTPRPLTAEERIRLIWELAEATGRPVDLIDLRETGEPLLGRILATGKRILGGSGEYAELIKRHLFDQADFAPYQRRILAERRRAWIKK